jgi:hypothetical protein
MKKKAVRENAIDTAKILLSIGKKTIEEIAKATKLPLEEVQKLAKPHAQ